ncbi:unnamed protein product [Schistosoma turkestanicum]|nr:unnamed protein product [Schistosoma turkestanicum]
MSFSTLDVIQTTNVTVHDGEKNKHEGKSIIIKYPGYRILIMDTGLSERHSQQDILSIIDVIIVLQWNTAIQLSLNNLFNETDNKQFIFKKSTCLILPMIDQYKHGKCNSIQNKSPKSTFIKNIDWKQMNWLHNALKLGLTILQVCNGNKFWTRIQCVQSMNSSVNEKLHLTLYNNNNGNHNNNNNNKTNQSIQKTNSNNEFLNKSLLLYEKFGLGKLKMFPITTGCITNSGLSYSVLFIWIPYEIEHSNHKNNTKVFFYSATLDAKGRDDSIDAEQSVNHQRETEQTLTSESITITKSLLQQLTRIVGMNCSINKKANNKRDVTHSQSKITRSKTFTSGLTTSKRTVCANGVRPATNPILRKSCEQKYENDMVKSLEDNPKQKTGIKQVTFSEMVKFDSIEDLGEKVTLNTPLTVSHSEAVQTLTPSIVKKISTETPPTPQTTTTTLTTNTDITTNIPDNTVTVSNGQNNDELFLEVNKEYSSEEQTETLLTKSTSCPSHLIQHTLTNHSRPTSLFEKGSDYHCYYNDQKYEQFPLSATVLLAIPEGGENDYYADSPQCLTVKELKELGLYASEDDDDDDDDDENEDEEDEGNRNNHTNDDETEGNMPELDNTLSDDRNNSSSFINETVSNFTEIHIPNNITLTHHEEVMIS